MDPDRESDDEPSSETERLFLRRLDAILDEQPDLQDVASAMGLRDKTALSHYRAGRRRPDIHKLAGLARHAGVTTDWLLGLSSQRRFDRFDPAEPVPAEWKPFDWLHVCGERTPFS